MSIKLELFDARGNKRALESAENLAANTQFGIDKALWQSGKDLQGNFNKQVLDKSAKTGRIYIRKNKGGARRKHQASAPGQSPANRTGKYRKAIGFNVRKGASELVFGNSAEYAGFLELGTSRMKPRPGLGNAVKSSERDIIRNLSTGIIKNL